MELREFVAETLEQIVLGVKQAQETTAGIGATVNPIIYGDDTGGLLRTIKGKTVAVVDFNVALTASDAQGTKAGAGILVGVLGIGAQGEAKSESATVNRIQFKVPVELP